MARAAFESLDGVDQIRYCGTHASFTLKKATDEATVRARVTRALEAKKAGLASFTKETRPRLLGAFVLSTSGSI